MEFVEGWTSSKHVRGDDSSSDSRDAMLYALPRSRPAARARPRRPPRGERCHRDIKPANVRSTRTVASSSSTSTWLWSLVKSGLHEAHAGRANRHPGLHGARAALGDRALGRHRLVRGGSDVPRGTHRTSPLRRPAGAVGGSPREEVELREWDYVAPRGTCRSRRRAAAPEPSARPEAAEILERLATARAQHQLRTGATRYRQARSISWEGRVSWTDLRRILRERHRTRVVEIHGESGIGKTELVRRFLKEVERRERRADPDGPVPSPGIRRLQGARRDHGLAEPIPARARRVGRSTSSDRTHAAALARLFPALEWLPKPDPSRPATRSSTRWKRSVVASARSATC